MLPTYIPDAVPAEALETLQARLTDAQRESGDGAVGCPLAAALLDNPVFRMSVHPRRLFRAELAHAVDRLDLDLPPSAIVVAPGHDVIRADVGVLVCVDGACTAALDAGYGPLTLRLAATDALIYQSSAPLTVLGDGPAWVARLWVESLVRSAAVREILHDLATASAFADLVGADDIEGRHVLRACYHDVLAMYAET